MPSTSGRTASISPTLAPCAQINGPGGRAIALSPRRSERRCGCSLPRASRRASTRRATGVASEAKPRYARRVHGSRSATAGMLSPSDRRARKPAPSPHSDCLRPLAGSAPASSSVASGGTRTGSPADRRAAAEGEINGCAVPIVEHVSPAGGEGHRKNRPPGLARQHHDAASDDAARSLAHRRSVPTEFVLPEASRATPGTRRARPCAGIRRRRHPNRGSSRRRAARPRSR